jgi:hypothetical protein
MVRLYIFGGTTKRITAAIKKVYFNYYAKNKILSKLLLIKLKI